MKNAKRIDDIGSLILVLGSALYAYELLCMDVGNLTLPISIIYIVALVLKLIGWVGTRDERRAAKAAAKAGKEIA